MGHNDYDQLRHGMPTAGWASDCEHLRNISYLILIDDLFVGEVGDRHLIVDRLSDLVLGSLAGFAGVEQVSQRLVVDFNKTCCEIELRKIHNEVTVNRKMSAALIITVCEDPFCQIQSSHIRPTSRAYLPAL